MEKIDTCARIKYLVNELNKHTELYDSGNPMITDKEWDDMYFELVALEQEKEYILPNSPTQRVNYTVVNELTKVQHNHPMLSLDKTKDIEEIKSFIGDRGWIAMLKLDGLTCSLLYENGGLVRAETRGDGEIGEDVTHNAMVIPSIPKRIPYKGRLVVDGEIICKLDDFKEFEGEYKNARNFASGSIRLLDSNECDRRKLTFVAWDCIDGYDEECDSLNKRLAALIDYNFEIVSFTTMNLDDAAQWLKSTNDEYTHYPIDGIVFKWNNCAEYESAGRTEHHFRGGIAYKFYDEPYETKLIDVEWTMGKTGTLTPTAIFEPVEIDGTTVERASLHNISILQDLCLCVDDTIEVYKANQIIPQVKRNISAEQRQYTEAIEAPVLYIPEYCPICGGNTEIRQDNNSKILVCTNDNCKGKLLGKLTHFVSKNAINIDGMSEATIDFLINNGWVKSFKDLYDLNYSPWVDEWKHTEGFGEKSVKKLLDSIEKSRNTTLDRFIYSLSIPDVGRSTAKTIASRFEDYKDFIVRAPSFNWEELDGIGSITAEKINNFINTYLDKIRELAYEFNFIEEDKIEIKATPFNGKSVAVTGKLIHFNRDSINAKLESLGAKPASGVTAKTHYLINNDPTSNSSKNKKANELNIPIITEKEFLEMIGE